ncbi:MAG: MBL fold metallo-hydrolase, partial [Candidatus Bathyarchaeia archaeon]
VDPERLKRILITHFHADHVGDLVALLWILQLTPLWQGQRSLKIVGGKGIRNFTNNVLKVTHFPSQLQNVRLTFKALGDSTVFEDITACKTLHSPVNLAYRITRGGRSFCFTGDTGYYEPLTAFARGCTALIHEAVFPSDQEALARRTNHSTAADAGRIAHLAGVEKLVLTHISSLSGSDVPTLIKEAKREFGGEVIAAEDFLTLTI